MTEPWPHYIEVLLSPHIGIHAKIVCIAQPGAHCRLWCNHGCEEHASHDEDGNEIPPPHELVDQGRCLTAEWVNDSDVDIFEAYDGPDALCASGAVQVTFWGDFVTWQYRQDDPQLS